MVSSVFNSIAVNISTNVVNLTMNRFFIRYKILRSILVCVIFFALGCVHSKPVQSKKSEIESDREHQQARADVFKEDSFKQQAAGSADNLKLAQKNSHYGFNRAEVGCIKNDTRVSDVIVGSAIDSALGATDVTDVDRYSVCTRVSYSNWLKLNWSCVGEETAFHKSKTSYVLRSGLKISFLDKYKKKLGHCGFENKRVV